MPTRSTGGSFCLCCGGPAGSQHALQARRAATHTHTRSTCSRSGLGAPAACAATRAAVTFVMNDSSGSTVSLVVCMMKASQVDLSARSSSCVGVCGGV